tara:strand:- start:206 stop:640 length:435 start_codon:yes stop_codon:yes gene_type:complete
MAPRNWAGGLAVFMLLTGLLLGLRPAFALTVNEVVRDLACPCICPLVLEDCNMTCGLDWKEEVGKKIKAGMSKQEIIDDFVSRYGESARLTPLQRIEGKMFQYTRSFGTMEWSMLWIGMAIWVVALFVGFYFGVRKLFFKVSLD